ncbi:MAG: hypothetical protein LBD48_08655 [Treponema sp.]|nr:hypothetical protein [Treponema sp.]
MSTIPTIFNNNFTSYTVVGGKTRLASTGLSAVLLNRGGCYGRRHLFQDFEKTGFDYVISIESSPDHYDVEELSSRFPFVRFVLLKKEITLGEQINLAAAELDTPLFFVTWNDLKIVAGGTARRMAERLCVNPGSASKRQRPAEPQTGAVEGVQKESNESKEDETSGPFFKQLCTVPLILNSRFEALPTLIVPGIMKKGVLKKEVRTLFLAPRREGFPSLYPFDGVGFYDRDRFIRMGGFDGTLQHTHWQFMDFGFRARLWGEEISSTQMVKLSYDSTVPAEDNSIDASYYRFYLKNIAPVFRVDHAHLPLRCFPGYLLKSGGDLAAAWEDFAESRRWVKTNCFRWRCDAWAIPGRWDHEPEAEMVVPGTGAL